MNAEKFPPGDVVKANLVFQAIEKRMRQACLSPSAIAFVVAGHTLTRGEAIAWVSEGAEEGFVNVRYILYSQPDGTMLIDLAAHSDAAAEASDEPPAV